MRVLKEMYDSSLILSINNRTKEFKIIKDRYKTNSPKTINNYKEMIDYFSRIIMDTKCFDSTGIEVFDDMFKKELCCELEKSVNFVLERHKLKKI